ncbi:hypothetical protein KSP40_PGU013244 [Platanthera guangdongensis]|uniref:Transcription repressor n=1 Tax=Platanthera guangdongensis TaxID=2320717 RepID=A0ABR2M6R8_9ASPA
MMISARRRRSPPGPAAGSGQQIKVRAIKSPKLGKKVMMRRQNKRMKGLGKSFVVVKSSSDPEKDFRESMKEMIVENKLCSLKELEELLGCYLALNSTEYHHLIVKGLPMTFPSRADLERKRARPDRWHTENRKHLRRPGSRAGPRLSVRGCAPRGRHARGEGARSALGGEKNHWPKQEEAPTLEEGGGGAEKIGRHRSSKMQIDSDCGLRWNQERDLAESGEPWDENYLKNREGVAWFRK